MIINSLRKAYYAGWRAGMASPEFQPCWDGLKRLQVPVCPYRCRLQFLHAFVWRSGQQDGRRQSINTWLALRSMPNA